MNEYELHCIAGDDLTLAVDFTDGGAALELAEGDRAELILHLPDGTEQVFAAAAQDGNTATFLLTGVQTAELLTQNPTGEFRYCVRLTFADGSRYTPVYRQLLLIAGC